LYESTLLSLDGRGAGGEGESACAVVTFPALVITVVTFPALVITTISFQSISQHKLLGNLSKFVGGLAPKQPNPSHWQKAQSLSQKKVMSRKVERKVIKKSYE
jgi:hypothetical protein